MTLVLDTETTRQELAQLTGRVILRPVFLDRSLMSLTFETTARTVYLPLRGHIPPADPLVLNAVGEWLAQDPDLWVESMADAVQLRHRWNLPLTPRGDITLLARLVGEGEPVAECSAWLDARMYRVETSAPRRALWQIELQTALVLAEQAQLGYLTPTGLAYPHWTTVQPNGSGRISCQQPNLMGVQRAVRGAWVAPDGAAWVELRVPHFEWRMLAALTDDPWVKAAVDDPLTALRSALDGGEPESLLYTFAACCLRKPFNASYVVMKCGVMTELATAWVTRLAAVAPVWATWAAEQSALPNGTALSLFDRPIVWDAASDDPVKTRMTALVQQSVATMLKTMVVGLVGQTRAGIPSYRGIENVIPLHEGMVYTIPHYLVFDHLRDVVRSLHRGIKDVAFPLVARVGSTWGTVADVSAGVIWDDSSTTPLGTARS